MTKNLHGKVDNRQRNSLLAVIHIAKAQLKIDEDDYREMVRTFAGIQSGSAGDGSITQLKRLIAYFERLGFRKSRRGKSARRSKKDVTPPQPALAYMLWDRLVNAGEIRDTRPTAFQAWCRSHTRRMHPDRAGWDVPEFMPTHVLGHVIEQLKKWCKRLDLEVY